MSYPFPPPFSSLFSGELDPRISQRMNYHVSSGADCFYHDEDAHELEPSVPCNYIKGDRDTETEIQRQRYRDKDRESDRERERDRDRQRRTG